MDKEKTERERETDRKTSGRSRWEGGRRKKRESAERQRKCESKWVDG